MKKRTSLLTITARDHCPNAKVSFDPFHVVALAHDALDQVRRAEVKHEADLKGIHWGTLKDATQRTRKQVDQMHWLQRSHLQTARAWRLKQALRRVYSHATDVEHAKVLLTAWLSWARRCRLAPFKRLAATVKKHLDGILEHFRSGLSNGFAEGLNGRIQAAKACARGYATDRHLIIVSYLICSNLKHLPKNPWTHATQQVAA